MGLPDDDQRALRTRLAPAGDDISAAVAAAVEDDEELREVLVDVEGDVVAFTDRRALFVGRDGSAAVAVGYADIEIRRRSAGLGIDALIEGGRLVLDVARGTFVRLGVIAGGAAPGRATWLPSRTPAPPVLEPTVAAPAPTDLTAPPLPPRSPVPAVAPISPYPPVPPVMPEPSLPGDGVAGWAPEPSAAEARGPASTVAGWTVPPMPPPGLPPAGWNPDPSGRHWWRWWDGMTWTDHVADGGSSFVDPLPPR